MSTNTSLPFQNGSSARSLLTLAVITSTVTMCLMTAAVIARITAKAFVMKKMYLEDCETQNCLVHRSTADP